MATDTNQLHFYASEAPKAQEALKSLTAQYGNSTLEKADVVIALGGDGTMLRALHEVLPPAHQNNPDIPPKPIFGMNCGKVGFLMNPYHEKNLPQRILAARQLKLKPLHMRATDVHGKITEARAFNEVTVIRRTHFSTHLRVLINDTPRLDELTCDGAMVATPTGSSGYNYSAYGPILPLGCKLLALTPISPYRPRRWRGALLPSRTRITFEVLEPERRPANAIADFLDFNAVQKVEVREDRKTNVPILFDPEEHLSERLLKEQFSL
ncbi:MAG: NAD kinase [Alphaproteobacteria bacterium]